MTTEPAIAILPYGLLFGAGFLGISCDALDWPLGQPDRLRGKALRDMTRQDHLIVYPRKALHYRPLFGLKARVSMMVQEPRAIHWDHRLLLRATWRKFHRILTHDRDLVSAIPNGVFVPFGTTWVPDWADLDLTKTRNCSLIASTKTSLEGHRLRHTMAQAVRDKGLDVDVMGSGYAAFERKSDGLAPYRYSVVIENGQEADYFTEKLIDAILCLTVPIYWGCPNIGDYFDTSAMILCNSEADLMDALSGLSETDYAARLDTLRAVRDTALPYTELHRRSAEALRDSL